MRTRGWILLVCGLVAFAAYQGADNDKRAAEAVLEDPHTIALWLFDDPSYPNTTLTDAGPHKYDLRLVCGYTRWWRQTEGKGDPPEEPLHVQRQAGIVPGKFGNAVRLPAGNNGSIEWPPNLQRYGTVNLNARTGGIPERFNLGYLDWTLEFWFRAAGEQNQPGTVYEIRNESDHRRAVPMVNSLRIDASRSRFLLSSKTITKDPDKQLNVELVIATDGSRLNDASWHHLAFTYAAQERQLRHYVDGRLMQLPAKGGFLPMMGKLVSLRIGENLRGYLDEVRLSDTLRYNRDFTPPSSFSKTQGSMRAPNRPNGPPHLFPEGKSRGGPIRIGSRKHLFIDDVLIENQSGLKFMVNPPVSFQATRFLNDRPWEPTPSNGGTIPAVGSIWDEGDEIRMLYTNSGMWGGKPHAVCLASSRDGLTWEKPVLNLEPWEGSTRNNIVLTDSCQGAVIKDPNPAAAPSERYKYVAWCMYRGIYVYTSPDGIHWRRNENCALPFDPDGSISLFWDDQRGVYRAYIRSLFASGHRRRTSRVDIPEILSPWPFQPAARPDLGDMELARPVRGELPLIDTGGEVYRFQSHKYPWAPDTYFAFPWRFMAGKNIRPGSFLMTSRDGENWQRYEDPYYFGAGWKLDGREVMEALMEHGMVRRGDEIWMFGTVRFTEHNGVLYGGVQHEGGAHDRLLKLVQRLDGFVSLDAGASPGSLITKPLVFEGEKLELNIVARQPARVALLEESGRAYKGFALEDCRPVRGDSVRWNVTWKGNPDLKQLAGKTVRMKIELQDAKLYALQFVNAAP